MSEQQLKLFLNNVLERKNEIINTIHNDPKYKKQLRTMVENLEITEKSFKTDITVILATVLGESKKQWLYSICTHILHGIRCLSH